MTSEEVCANCGKRRGLHYDQNMQYVLVFRTGYTNLNADKNGIDCEYFQKQSFWFTYEKWGFGATHWQPLPSPPLEVKKETKK